MDPMDTQPKFKTGQEVVIQCCRHCRPSVVRIVGILGKGDAGWCHPGPEGKEIAHHVRNEWLYKIRHPISEEETGVAQSIIHIPTGGISNTGASFDELMQSLKSEGE